MTNDERAIRDLVANWLNASTAGDTTTVMELIADDVIFMVPGQEPFGKEAFARTSEGLKNFRMEAESDIQEVQVLGDWAYLRNRLRVSMTPLDGGEAIRRAGYTLTILRKKQDGKWLLARDANLLAAE
jgi:uncharacterized protein (TIGR02246 family)